MGTAATVLGLGKAHAMAHGYDFSASSRFGWSLAYAGLLMVAGYGAGLPELPRSRRSLVVTAATSSAVAALAISVVQLLLGAPLLPRFVVLASPAVLLPLALLCSALATDGRARDGRRDRVVAVVGVDEGIALADELADRPERPAQLVSVLRPEAAGSSSDRADGPLIAAATAGSATAVVLDRAAQADDSVVAQAAQLHEAGVRVRTLSLFYDEWLGKLPVSELERVALMFDIGELHRSRYGRAKRVVDAVVAGAGLIPFTLAVPVVALGNRVANRGPLFYRQDRIGRGGHVFSILKFRTMTPSTGVTEWTAAGDPRVTPFGAWMRRSHLDELPQVLNILLGHLSVVGPRPEQPRYVEELAGKIPFYRMRHLVRPGLTGWAQVKYPYGGSEADALEKLQYEFYYLRHQSLSLDLRVIGRTLRAVVVRSGR
ncbi:MAG: sugar transferase [Acidimicrobiales bacterium]